MNQKMIPTVLLTTAIFCSAPCALRASDPITIESLLNEMVNRDSLARFPETNFRLKQHSSYNRASVSPDDEAGWFANGDFNKGTKAKNFIRIEENN